MWLANGLSKAIGWSVLLLQPQWIFCAAGLDEQGDDGWVG